VRAVVAAAVLLTGCFYIDPIVPRPGITINRAEPPNDVPHRGAAFTLTADFDNPKPRFGTYDWQAFACNVDGSGNEACDGLEFFLGNELRAVMTVPVRTSDLRLVNRIKVKVAVKDDVGAAATAEENIAVVDGPPIVVPTESGTLAVGTPVELSMRFNDPDDALNTLSPLPPNVIGRALSAYTLTPEDEQIDPMSPYRTRRFELIAHEAGLWHVAFFVQDPSGLLTEAQIDFTIQPDNPPCLAQWEPIASPAAALPVSEPTVFQVPLVTDNLDAYPPISSEPPFGTTAFEWSILRPGAAMREVLAGATGNRIDFDPAAFTPGDLVEIRVQIYDHNNVAVSCPDNQPTCALVTPGCLQRQTWRVEVR
jgi:hypothetical protein